TPTITEKGIPVRWPEGARYNLAGNPRNNSGLSARSFFGSITRSLQRWKAGSLGAVDFAYWQGEDARTFLPVSAYDGLSSVHFASAAADGAPGISPNLLGLTQLFYDSTSGEILEADI